MIRRSLIISALLCLCVVPVRAATLTTGQQLILLERANQAFEQALARPGEQTTQGFYQQAIDAYEKLIAAGVHNGKLYYNLGNAYFLRNDLGLAILQYRRGLRLEPGNRRLQANLQYALSRRMDQIEVKTTTRRSLVSRLLFWHDDLSLRFQVSLALIAFLFVWGCALAHWFWRRSPFLWLLGSAAFVFLLFAGSALLVHVDTTTTRHGVVVVQEAPVRKGNGESYALQFSRPLHPGAEFEVLETRSAWLHVRLDNGATGWIRQDHAALW